MKGQALFLIKLLYFLICVDKKKILVIFVI